VSLFDKYLRLVLLLSKLLNKFPIDDYDEKLYKNNDYQPKDEKVALNNFTFTIGLAQVY
jgi:hypothetical protein